jgi:hypothetical protein
VNPTLRHAPRPWTATHRIREGTGNEPDVRDRRRTSEVFYVGKGVGNRCFAHVQVARKMEAGVSGDYPKLDRIREIEAAGQRRCA